MRRCGAGAAALRRARPPSGGAGRAPPLPRRGGVAVPHRRVPRPQVKQRLLGNRASASRHVLCERQGKINEAYKKLQDGWLTMGTKSLLFSLLRSLGTSRAHFLFIGQLIYCGTTHPASYPANSSNY